MGRKVLVAEDDLVMAGVIGATLEAVGHEVVVVATGEEALTLAIAAHPDVVVMDVNLAGEMNGIETARRLRRRSACPVIFHTGHTDAEHRAGMLAISNASIVPKPGHIVRLVDAVATAPDVAR